jgi:hypothetical protein
VNTTKKPSGIRRLATRELAYLTGFLFFGLIIMPVIIYQVGQSIFGVYGGVNYGDFFGTLSGKVRSGDYVAWFLVLSPYLAWQSLRLMMLAWRISGRSST